MMPQKGGELLSSLDQLLRLHYETGDGMSTNRHIRRFNCQFIDIRWRVKHGT